MAATTSSSSGSTVGPNRATTAPSGPMTNFSKFQRILPAVAAGVQEVDDFTIERVAVLAVDLDLLRHREGDTVCRRTELGNLLGAARLLAHELIGWYADHRKPAVLVALLQPFSAAYCGVSPHFDAVLTNRTALPRYCARFAGPPRSAPISISKMDMLETYLVRSDQRFPHNLPLWLPIQPLRKFHALACKERRLLAHVQPRLRWHLGDA